MKLSKFCNKISLILQALWCAVLYFLIEALCRHSVVEAWDYMTGKPLVFAYNTMFIFTTMLIVYLFHRRCFWRVVVSVFWLFLGIVNCILLMNRVTPFTRPDLHMLTYGSAIMQKYLPFYGVVIGLLLSFVAVVLRATNPPRSFRGMIPGKEAYYDLKRNRNAYPIRHTIIYRFSENLFFANVKIFQSDIENSIKEDTKVVIVDAAAINSIDVTAADRLHAGALAGADQGQA